MSATASAREQARLAVEGMTCASCAVRIERKLNKLEGVHASVNFATEQAAVEFDPARVRLEELLAAVESIGYHARSAGGTAEDADPTRPLLLRLAAAAALTLPLTLVAMVPPLQFGGWEWLALVLATPVVLWSGLGFHRAALASARHGAATMDTLALVGGGARRRSACAHLLRGWRGDRDADPAGALVRGARAAPLRGGDPGAARAGREGGTGAARLRGARRPGRGAAGGRPLRRSPGREDRHRRRRRGGRLGGRPVDADRRVDAGRG